MNRAAQMFFRLSLILSLSVTTLVVTTFQSRSQSIELPSFKSILCSGNIQVRYQVGTTNTLTFHNLSEQKVRYYVDKEQLVIKSTTSDRKQSRVLITLTGAPLERVRVQKNAIIALDSLTIADSCTFISQIAGEINADINNSFLSVKSVTGSLIQIKGSTKTLQIKSSGGSKVRARELLYNNALLSVKTGAFVDLKDIGRISGKISSGGELRIIGNSIPQTISTQTKGIITLSNE